ncbi:gibberellin receptor GID1C isoform X2 [Physcomitrium patens]|uniref:gibberellin receptor GID1C isoform X2 n=1 Tax=Physcomitrium patens TaxID=3218 RepID=UPI000D178AF1|nr:gibberellin receptor GID1C-like isoform X2 [Physcomitrium patens]|eukprot:XP_024402344.1 gibberellin receptor GID1C-like isoform X2 [Physcomitrella patens]
MTSMWALRILSRFLAMVGTIPRRKDGTVHRKLADLFEWVISANPQRADGVVAFDVVVDAETGIWVRVFVPAQGMGGDSSELNPKADEMMPVIVYYHGGGRAPEHKCPTAYNDCYAVLEWLNSEKAEAILPANVDLSRVYLAGDSAGGNIAHHVAILAAGKDLSPLTLRGLVLIQPFFGGEERTAAELQMKDPLIVSLELLDWYWKAYLPPDSNRDHPASNVFGPYSRDISNVAIPPVLVIVGGLDPLQEWQMKYVKEMVTIGKKVEVCFFEDGVHMFGQLKQIEIAEQMLIDIASFLENREE